MKRPSTLSKGAQYALVYQQGSTYVCDVLVMKVLRNGSDVTRVGYSVSRKLGKAVRRNRIRRQLKEIVRRQPVKTGWDAVFIARPGAAVCGFDEVWHAVTVLLARAGLMQEPDEEPNVGLD